GAVSTPRHAAAIAATSLSASGARCRYRVSRVSAEPSPAVPGSSERAVRTTATGNAATWSARYASTASVSRSAQCMSSSTTTAPRSADSQRTTRSIASASTTGAGGTAGNAGPAAQCGTTVPSAGRYG